MHRGHRRLGRGRSWDAQPGEGARESGHILFYFILFYFILYSGSWEHPPQSSLSAAPHPRPGTPGGPFSPLTNSQTRPPCPPPACPTLQGGGLGGAKGGGGPSPGAGEHYSTHQGFSDPFASFPSTSCRLLGFLPHDTPSPWPLHRLRYRGVQRPKS